MQTVRDLAPIQSFANLNMAPDVKKQGWMVMSFLVRDCANESTYDDCLCLAWIDDGQLVYTKVRASQSLYDKTDAVGLTQRKGAPLTFDCEVRPVHVGWALSRFQQFTNTRMPNGQMGNGFKQFNIADAVDKARAEGFIPQRITH